MTPTDKKEFQFDNLQVVKYKEHYDQEIENEQRFIRKPTDDIANQLTEQWGYKVNHFLNHQAKREYCLETYVRHATSHQK
jgi:hypothetical protein